MPDSPAFTLSLPLILTLAFALALATGFGLKTWLAGRQLRAVARGRAAVPTAFAERIPLAAHHKAADYTRAKLRFGMLEAAFGAALILGWTLLGGLNALNQALLGWLGGGMWQQLALLAAFVVIGGVLDLPGTLYQTFVLEQHYGFNQLTPKLWLMDLLKSTLIGAAIGLPIAAAILWLMGSAGSLWWLWAWALWTGFNLLLMWIYPTFIAPLFNKFEPLPDKVLAARVQALMKRCGFSAKGLFVMDGSRRSAHANAYFTGLGAAKRVVFFDTLLRQLAPGEVEAVLAHELGHFHHRHVLKRMVVMFAISLAGFALLGWLSSQVWFYFGLGVRPNLMSLLSGGVNIPSDALALLLFLLVVPVFTVFLSPLFAHFSRSDEFQADAYAVAQTGNTDLATALLKLYEDNASTLTPDPLYVRFYYSHPAAVERLGRIRGGAPAGAMA